MPKPLTRQQLGELSARFLDMHDEVDGPIYRAGFVALAETGDNETTVIVRSTSDNAMLNIKMFNDAGVLEFAAFAQAAMREIKDAKGEAEVTRTATEKGQKPRTRKPLTPEQRERKNAYERARRAKDPERQRALRAARFADPEKRARQREAARKFFAKPEVRRRHKARLRERRATDPEYRAREIARNAEFNHSFAGVASNHRYKNRKALERLEAQTKEIFS